jgi:hypothetical protein
MCLRVTFAPQKNDLKDEELRPYFALPAVLDGLFKVGRAHNVGTFPKLTCLLDGKVMFGTGRF